MVSFESDLANGINLMELLVAVMTLSNQGGYQLFGVVCYE
jgi:hypothetical protein